MASVSDFDYVITTILGQSTDSPLSKAFKLAGVFNVGDTIMGHSNESITKLQFEDDSAPPITKTLPKGFQQLVKCFQTFILQKILDGDPVHSDLQNNFKLVEFAAYRISQGVEDIPEHGKQASATMADDDKAIILGDYDFVEVPDDDTFDSKSNMYPTPDELFWNKAEDARILESKTGIHKDPLDGEIAVHKKIIDRCGQTFWDDVEDARIMLDKKIIDGDTIHFNLPNRCGQTELESKTGIHKDPLDGELLRSSSRIIKPVQDDDEDVIQTEHLVSFGSTSGPTSGPTSGFFVTKRTLSPTSGPTSGPKNSKRERAQ